jgi:hypothetical protein
MMIIIIQRAQQASLFDRIIPDLVKSSSNTPNGLKLLQAISTMFCHHVCPHVYRDVTTSMANDGVEDIRDFKWESQLRYYWEHHEAPPSGVKPQVLPACHRMLNVQQPLARLGLKNWPSEQGAFFAGLKLWCVTFVKKQTGGDCIFEALLYFLVTPCRRLLWCA